MLKKVQLLSKKANDFTPKSEEDLNNFKVEYLGKKGVLNSLFSDFKTLRSEEKKELGPALNNLKTSIQKKFDQYKKNLHC